MDIRLFRTDKQGTVVASTDGISITWNLSPCNDYTPGDPADKPASAQSSSVSSSTASSQSVSVSTEYILNTSTRKIHYPDCKSVKQMSEKKQKIHYRKQGFSYIKRIHPLRKLQTIIRSFMKK